MESHGQSWRFFSPLSKYTCIKLSTLSVNISHRDARISPINIAKCRRKIRIFAIYPVFHIDVDEFNNHMLQKLHIPEKFHWINSKCASSVPIQMLSWQKNVVISHSFKGSTCQWCTPWCSVVLIKYGIWCISKVECNRYQWKYPNRTWHISLKIVAVKLFDISASHRTIQAII